jgi:hypothetical protein
MPRNNDCPVIYNSNKFEILSYNFSAAGFRGGLNYYCNPDHNRELLTCFGEIKDAIPALYGGETRRRP